MQRRAFLHATWTTALAHLSACGGGSEAPAPPAPPAPPGETPPGGTLRTVAMPLGRAEHVSVQTPDGRVLMLGGTGHESALPDQVLAFEPGADRFVVAGALTTGRLGHTATVVGAGRVLVFGGARGLSGSPVAEIFDLATGRSRPTHGAPRASRTGHSATRLADGRVLLVGGVVPTGGLDGSADLFDPVTEQFLRLDSSLLERRQLHCGVLVDETWVMVYGGSQGGQAAPPELFHVPSLRFGATALPLMEAGTRLSAVPLRSRDGQLLFIGGEDIEGYPLAGLVSVSPKPPYPGALHGLREPRHRFAAATLADGRVLVAGGLTTLGTATSAGIELFDPVRGVSVIGPSMAQARHHHSGDALADGRVLLAGGYSRFNAPLTTAEIYTPAVS